MAAPSIECPWVGASPLQVLRLSWALLLQMQLWVISNESLLFGGLREEHHEGDYDKSLNGLVNEVQREVRADALLLPCQLHLNWKTQAIEQYLLSTWFWFCIPDRSSATQVPRRPWSSFSCLPVHSSGPLVWNHWCILLGNKSSIYKSSCEDLQYPWLATDHCILRTSPLLPDCFLTSFTHTQRIVFCHFILWGLWHPSAPLPGQPCWIRWSAMAWGGSHSQLLPGQQGDCQGHVYENLAS